MNFIDELQFAIEAMEKRCEEGLTPKLQVLETIIVGVSGFDSIVLPEGTLGLPRIPRSPKQWIALLEATLEEAKLTKLINDPRIIDIFVETFLRLKHYDKCAQLVHDALSRGITVNDKLVETVLSASKTADHEDKTSQSNMRQKKSF